MSLVKNNKKPVKIFLVATLVSIALLYGLCDYYLKSVGRELMLNWVRTEASSIQEGNLLTSATKYQNFLLSSDYIRAVKLVRLDGESVQERLRFGKEFEVSLADIPKMSEEIILKRSGFLHHQAFYKIPNRDEMFVVFDVRSIVLNSVFSGVSLVLFLMLVLLVAIIRNVEEKDYMKREELFKQAITDFISNDKPSDVINSQIPTLTAWWKDKKEQVETAQQLAIQNQSKILLGEIASRVGHDIMGSVRNIEILTRRVSGLSNQQADALKESINKIKLISADISKQTKKSIQDEVVVGLENQVSLNQIISSVIEQKKIQYQERVNLSFDTDEKEVVLSQVNPVEFERSISNLVSNAIEASKDGSSVSIDLKSSQLGIEVKIKDNGLGISPDNLEKIGIKGFTVGKANGTGIGVFYAKQFIERMGGQFFIQSKLGEGTVVSLILTN